MTHRSNISQRFRGFLPVVIDVETGGFNAKTDALLELAAVPILMDHGQLIQGNTYHYHVEPFHGANIEQAALDFTGIEVDHPFREAEHERDILPELFSEINLLLKAYHCSRAILVGHNAWFDLSFINAAIERCRIKNSPFHKFSSFDTATLAGMAYGQTVLAKACKMAQIDFDTSEAHSALYDTQKTADLFCKIHNQWSAMGGWPPAKT